MSNRAMLWTSLIGIPATIALVQPAAVAATAIAIAKTAKAITVKISEPGSQGSGVLLQRQGDIYTVLTAAHVVRNKSVSYTIATADGKKYQVDPSSIRTAATDIDLAVVKFRAATANYPTAKLGNCNLLSEGMDLYVSGYPLATATINKSLFVFRTGTVSANSTQTLEKGYSLVYSNDTLPGMSGGAVLNQNGELVAIHGRGDRERNADGGFGQKTGFNLGIPVNRFAAIASNLGVNLHQKVPPIPQNRELKAEDYYALARQKYDRGDYKGALADYDRAIEIKSSYAKAYRARATVRDAKLDDPQGALTDLDRAIALDPNDGLAYSVRGLLKYDKLNDARGALADYNRAIQLDPNTNAKVYALRGGLKLQNLNDDRGALVDINRSIQLDPSDGNTYLLRGIIKYQKLKDSRSALADINRSIQLNPQNANAYLVRGLVHNSVANRDRAMSDLRQAAKLAQQQGDQKTYQNANAALKQLGSN